MRCDNISVFPTGLVCHSDLLHSILWPKKIVVREIQLCSHVPVRATCESCTVSCILGDFADYYAISYILIDSKRDQLPPVLFFRRLISQPNGVQFFGIFVSRESFTGRMH